MSITSLNGSHYYGASETLLNTSAGETDTGELDEKMKKMQEMMSNMEELNNAMLKTLYMQIFMAPEEKIMEW